MGAAGRLCEVLLLGVRLEHVEPQPDGESYAIRFGVFDSDPGIRPSVRQFVAYAAPWDEIPDDGLPRFPERRPPDA